jgi:hypothetical protein
VKLAKSHKVLIAVLQVALIAVCFFAINGVVAVALYLVSEISLAEIGDFILGLWSGEGLALVGYHYFRKMKHRLSALLNDSSDEPVVSQAKIKELKKLLRK